MKKIYINLVIVASYLLTASVLAKDPNFSFKNKSNKDIVISITSREQQEPSIFMLKDITDDKNSIQISAGNYPFGEKMRLSQNRSFVLDLQNGTYKLDIWYQNRQGKEVNLFREFELKKGSTFYVKFKSGNIADEYILLPQDGFFFKTTDGYSLSKNVRKENLVLTPSQQSTLIPTLASTPKQGIKPEAILAPAEQISMPAPIQAPSQKLAKAPVLAKPQAPVVSKSDISSTPTITLMPETLKQEIIIPAPTVAPKTAQNIRSKPEQPNVETFIQQQLKTGKMLYEKLEAYLASTTVTKKDGDNIAKEVEEFESTNYYFLVDRSYIQQQTLFNTIWQPLTKLERALDERKKELAEKIGPFNREVQPERIW